MSSWRHSVTRLFYPNRRFRFQRSSCRIENTSGLGWNTLCMSAFTYFKCGDAALTREVRLALEKGPHIAVFGDEQHDRNEMWDQEFATSIESCS